MSFIELLYGIVSCTVLWRIHCGAGKQIGNGKFEEEFEICPLPNTIKEQNLRTIAIPLSSLPGKWVSQECETRAELKYPYLLRMYTFYSNHSFDLVQIFYKDEFCSSAVYAISARGYMSWNWNSNYRPHTYLTRVTIVLHDFDLVTTISRHVNKACPNMTERFWKPFVEYEIFALNTMANHGSNGGRNIVRDNLLTDRSKRNHEKSDHFAAPDPNCLLFSLDISFDELFNMKIYRRPHRNGDKYELFLGKQRSGMGSKRRMMSNSFQLPLLLYDESIANVISTYLANSTPMFVPTMYQKAKLPQWASLHGEWISQMCEPIPQRRFDTQDGLFELFATRNLRIDNESGRWELQIKYYSEPSCARLIAEQQSYGLCFRGFESNNVHISATEIDFETEKSFLLVWNSSFVQRIRNDPVCGYYKYWEVGVKIEALLVTCSNTRFSSLSRRNIFKIDYSNDDQGNELLYFGEEEDEDERAKDFGYPLIRCSLQTTWKFWSKDSSISLAANQFIHIICTGLIFINRYYVM